jgi:hypothetical protein
MGKWYVHLPAEIPYSKCSVAHRITGFFGLFPLSSILENREHDISGTGSVFVLRSGVKTPTQLGPLERGEKEIQFLKHHVFWNTGQWKKSKYPVILYVTHHHQNHLEYKCSVVWLLVYSLSLQDNMCMESVIVYFISYLAINVISAWVEGLIDVHSAVIILHSVTMETCIVI